MSGNGELRISSSDRGLLADELDTLGIGDDDARKEDAAAVAAVMGVAVAVVVTAVAAVAVSVVVVAVTVVVAVELTAAAVAAIVVVVVTGAAAATDTTGTCGDGGLDGWEQLEVLGTDVPCLRSEAGTWRRTAHDDTSASRNASNVVTPGR